MRTIKFRVLDTKLNEWIYFTLDDLIKHHSTYEKKYGYEYWTQFTGLLDKKGVEIYGGDIMRIKGQNYSYFWKVIWDGQSASFDAEDIDELPDYLDWNEMVIDKTDNIEVVGNIYENPELLEVLK